MNVSKIGKIAVPVAIFTLSISTGFSTTANAEVGRITNEFSTNIEKYHVSNEMHEYYTNVNNNFNKMVSYYDEVNKYERKIRKEHYRNKMEYQRKVDNLYAKINNCYKKMVRYQDEIANYYKEKRSKGEYYNRNYAELTDYQEKMDSFYDKMIDYRERDIEERYEYKYRKQMNSFYREVIKCHNEMVDHYNDIYEKSKNSKTTTESNYFESVLNGVSNFFGNL